ncbi:MAG TPA: polyprenyl synthetase family protein [Nitrosopumilus sp.]|jgi:geranylgeranyl diphosphate synthase type I|nr:geranylgeranyl pyrophosphate synthase [Nitrososphaerota archaeon]MDP6327157.1 polyprenyl synthetase family protein [Nitrosopumilus sp.]HJL67762.1 polyprenyl synthetase family protein [Nitrosopumilus sp.]HJM25684.1 polyprenyl synthetase family protein [Nitrosopumilus sp.]HJO31311.1 polyprenyl synthetase family protein [Nitrosopumilus sp.]|tara:strand:+ start:10168 stop:11148 length:981 start_codon:yes stop_codon:yes gene_type:complete
MKKTKQIEKNATIVNKYLNSKLKGNPKKLYDAAGHLIIHGGKRLRPYMVIRSCQIVGGKSSNALSAASAVEMIHNFSLVHDDIMDNDEMRHGVPTVHKKYGMPLAILAGDVLFSKAFQIISDSKLSASATTQLVSRLAKACVDICEGQLLDVKMAEERKIPSQAEYITMIGKKTAALFDVSCAMGAICASNKIKDISNLSSFGRNLGIAFQITDDLIGVMGDPKVTKKPVGNDLREGKKSLPILMAIKLAKGKDKKIILKAFGNSKVSKKDLMKAVDTIRDLRIEENVRKQALKYAEKAEKSLTKYSGSAKTELITLLDFVVKRSV